MCVLCGESVRVYMCLMRCVYVCVFHVRCVFSVCVYVCHLSCLCGVVCECVCVYVMHDVCGSLCVSGVGSVMCMSCVVCFGL